MTECSHPDKDQINATTWECQHCEALIPMTHEEMDWDLGKPENCRVCGHSERFGGPLYQITGAGFLKNRTIKLHAACY